MERSGIYKKYMEKSGIYNLLRPIKVRVQNTPKKVRVQPHSNFLGESAAECEYAANSEL